MKKRSTQKSFSLGSQASFDWQVREDSSQSATETVASIDAPTPRRRPWTLLAAITLAVLALGYWGGQALMQRAEANLEQVEAEVAEALLLERNDAGGDYRPPNLTNLDAEIAEEWGAGVSLIELHMDMALVEVIINQPSEPWYTQPYQVARVLRQDGKGWQPIAPAHTFWRDQQTLASTYFEFSHSGRDEQALTAVTADLESAYLRMHKDLALTPPAPNAQLPIKIALVNGSPVRVTDLSYSGDTLIIPPPDLIPRPLHISHAEALRQTITYALAVKLFTERQAETPVPCTWNAVAEGIGLWLRWENHTLPSRRQWIYQSTINEWGQTPNVPRLGDLLSFPLSCTRPPSILEVEVLNSGRPIPRAELASTLIAYIAATHGREVITEILQGLDDFTDWDDLTQRTLGMPAHVLEAEWQTYLASQAP